MSMADLSSPLTEELAERIRQQGRITFYEWMKAALYHPRFGYYSRSDLKRWGRAGDYRTSPERSELFAATFARYFAFLYEQLGQPAVFTVVEMGAGEGHFAAGVLEVLRESFHSVFDATRYVIHERSKDSRLRAVAKLEQYESKVEFIDIRALDPVDAVVFFSNELLDAFPVHRVRSFGGELRELYVGISAQGKFEWVSGELSSDQLAEFCRTRLPTLANEQTVEVNLDVRQWFRTINEKLKNGYVITVDYGAEAADLYGSPGRTDGTLRGFSQHRFVEDLLEAPGEYDITTSVDWTYVKDEGQFHGFEVVDFTQLDKFLMSAGVLEELESRLALAVSDADKSRLTTAAREMILPVGMASSFQVLIQKR